MRKQLSVVQDLRFIRNPRGAFPNDDDLVSNLNAYVELNPNAIDDSQKNYLIKRPGLTSQTVIAPSPAPPGVSPIVRDAAINTSGDRRALVIYSSGTLAGTSVYYNNASSALPGTWAGNGGAHMIETLASNAALYGGYYWAFTNFLEGAVVSASGAITEITDADYTAWTTKSNMCALDGYLFQADYSSQRIYNSDLNAPTSWTALGFISANLYPGIIMRLHRVRNYLVAFKSRSVEFFQNDGNPTPGSPLTPVPQLARRYGLYSTGWLSETKDGVVWAGTDPSGKPGIFKLSFDSLAIEELSNEFVSNVMQENGTLGGPNLISSPGLDEVNKLNVISFKNKEFVILPVTMAFVTSLVYDTTLKTWGLWNAETASTTTSFPCSCPVRVLDGTKAKILVTGLPNDYAFYEMSETVYTDNGNTFTVKWTSDRLDFGTNRRKFLNSLEVLYDIGDFTGGTPTLAMTYHDTDNATDNVSARNATLNGSGSNRALFRRLGSFRNRSFMVSMNSNAPLRIGAIEVDLSMAEDDIG